MRVLVLIYYNHDDGMSLTRPLRMVWFGACPHTASSGSIASPPLPHAHTRALPQELGKYGIVCVEDLIHEIYSCGPHFKQVRRVA